MATASPPAPSNNKPAAAPGPQPRTPPEERFWIRYSPHHELPVSLAGSFLLHVLGIVLLALIVAGVLTRLIDPTRPVEVSPIMIGGGGGDPEGVGDGPNTGVLPQRKETITPETRQPLVSAQPKVPTPEVKPIDKKPEPRLQVPSVDGDRVRAIQEQSTAAVLGQLSDIGKKARAHIDGILAGQGKGGPGSGGGQGSGRGPGTGDGIGPGSGKPNQRTKRQQRWVMGFQTRDGNDYLRQLQHLGAILAVPQPSGDYMVFRNLASRPLKGKVEDIQTINRIYWVDDKPPSVASLAQAMGLPFPPPYIAAFFPEELERNLRKQEEGYYKGSEDNIEETRFQVTLRGRKYVPVLINPPRLRGQ